MRSAALAACLSAAACAEPGGAVFGVDGFADVALPQRGSVIALWEVKTASPPYFYKYGDGIRVGSQFSLGWDADPPAQAIGADGIGVAIFVLLPEFTTVPDGQVRLDDLPIQGLSSDTGVVYRLASSTGPPWSDALPPRFSCVACVRSQTGDLDGFELLPCAGVILEGPASPRCDW